MTNQPRLLFAPLLVIGMLSDIFDGVLARALGVVRPWLRRFDSATDVFYYLCIFVATWLVAREAILETIAPVVVLVASEIAVIGVSLLRFSKMPATHTYAAKAYGLVIFAAFLAVLAFNFGAWVFWLLAAIGVVANIEILVILGLSRTPPVDVLSVIYLKKTR